MNLSFHFRLPGLMLAPLLTLLMALPGVAHAAAAQQCVADLDDARAFIAANDAGAAALLAERGPALAAAYDTAHAAALRATDAAACQQALTAYVRAWRNGHLSIVPARAAAARTAPRPSSGTPAGDDPRAPRLALLSKDTLLLTLPTFDDRYAGTVRDLVAANRAALASHRNWIVDVRNNNGGSDRTYHPLMGWLVDGPVPGYQTEYYVTPANVAAQEAICAATSDPAGCARQMAPVLAAMRDAPAGSYVLAGGQRMEYLPFEPEPQRPARVALLTDQPCGSSCEQFVLEVRTSFRVKVLGRPTYGVIDISNLRPHPLPSGRVLMYATTRTARLPDMRIDGIGIAPDILLPRPLDAAGRDAEVKRVQRWLETGSLEDPPSGTMRP